LRATSRILAPTGASKTFRTSRSFRTHYKGLTTRKLHFLTTSATRDINCEHTSQCMSLCSSMRPIYVISTVRLPRTPRFTRPSPGPGRGPRARLRHGARTRADHCQPLPASLRVGPRSNIRPMRIHGAGLAGWERHAAEGHGLGTVAPTIKIERRRCSRVDPRRRVRPSILPGRRDGSRSALRQRRRARMSEGADGWRPPSWEMRGGDGTRQIYRTFWHPFKKP
jgi:hypothetical protein